MTPLFWISILWVFAATVVALLPMRRQMIPGLVLLIAAPVLIALIAWQVGWVFGALAFWAFVSMFRNPLRYFWARARGLHPQLPPEFDAPEARQ